jgi:thiamine biosynthesis lipoprotein ApbE
VDILERRWSRFLPESDISRINRGSGHDVEVDPSTLDLLAFAIAAWRETDGLFSPFLGRAMDDIGYSRSWSTGVVLTPKQRPSFAASQFRVKDPAAAAPMQLDYNASTVTVEPDVRIDLGGLAKGYAADLVLRELLSNGATTALVDLGGDMAFLVRRVAGTVPVEYRRCRSLRSRPRARHDDRQHRGDRNFLDAASAMEHDNWRCLSSPDRPGNGNVMLYRHCIDNCGG